jgi:hypothetical protein
MKTKPAALTLLLALFLLGPAAVRAQWTPPDASGNVSSTNTGNVGVGTGAAPGSKLEVKGGTSDASASAFNVTDSLGRSLFFVKNNGQISIGLASTWNTFGVFTPAGTRGGLSIVGDGTATNYGDLMLSPANTSTIAAGKPINFSFALMKDGVFGGDASGPSLALVALRQGGGFYAPLIVNPNGNLILAGAAGATNGNIGVGTNTPGILNGVDFSSFIPLHVKGGTNARFLTIDSANPSSGFIINDSSQPADGRIWSITQAAGAGKLTVSTYTDGGSNSNKLVLDRAGNLGVGALSPAFKLDVAGQVRSSSGGFVFPDGTSQTTASAGTLTGVTAGSGLTGGGSAGSLTLNVGAGTGLTSGADSLSVNYGSAAGTAVQGNTSLTLTAGSGMSGGGQVTLGSGGSVTLTNEDRGSAQNIFKGVANAAGALQFSAASNNDAVSFEGTGGTTVSFNAAAKRVTINSAAAGAPSGWTDGGTTLSATNLSTRVGIGTAAPGRSLSINAATAPALGLSVGGAERGTLGVTTQAGDWFAGTAAGDTTLRSQTSDLWLGTYSGARPIRFVTNDAQRVVIDGAGKVGVGTNAPLYSLDVSGGVNGFRAKAATTSSADAVASFENAAGVQAIIRGNGNLGLGTTSPAAKMDVRAASLVAGANTAIWSPSGTADANTSYAHFGTTGDWYLRPGTTSGKVVLADNGGTVGVGTNNPAAAYKLDVNGGVNVTGSLNATQNLTVAGTITGGTIMATYQDVAEWVPSTQELSAGTVVVLDTGRTNHVLASGDAYDTKVAGVVSAQPGLILGVGGEGKLKVATTGRVKVKVDATRGAIKVGDLLVTSETQGLAMKSVPVDLGGTPIHRPGTIIGKALEPLEKGVGEILVLLSLQ